MPIVFGRSGFCIGLLLMTLFNAFDPGCSRFAAAHTAAAACMAYVESQRSSLRLDGITNIFKVKDIVKFILKKPN